jgi:Kef-type K+ transport system membrane component KefB
MSPAASIIIGGGLALSSSAFVLQLLKDKDMLSTEYGKNAFGVLLLQDLMVVPLLVITPILAGTGGGIGNALASAGVQITMALSIIALIGKYVLNPVYNKVAAAQSQEAFVGLVLFTVLGMSFLTEGLGLSNTLGAFLAGVLLAENPHVHSIEREASPIRGILVGLFFFTVGFEIDLKLIVSKLPLVGSLVGGLVLLKTVVAAQVAKSFGLPFATAQRIGLVLSQGGEFAFVAFRMARSYGILSEQETKLMLTVVSLTMALTPMLEDYGANLMAVAASGGKKKLQ